MARKLFAILSGIVMFTFGASSQAQTINMSLNLRYTDSANPALGGNWTLVAKTSGVHGIAGISAIISNINFGATVLQPGIGAAPIETQQTGTTVEWVYYQNLATPANVVTQVGRGIGTPGNQLLDPLNDPAWNNAAKIATGTFGATRPAFTTLGGESTDGNVLSIGSQPFYFATDAAVTAVVRDVIVGDYNRNGTVDAADYIVWRKTLGAMGPGLPADGSGNNIIDENDYTAWRRGFGLSGGSTMGASPPPESPAAVPEPASALMIVVLLGGLNFHVRKRSAARVRTSKCLLPALALLLSLSLFTTERAQALPLTWIGGNVNWVDGGSTANWNPADEPDADDEAIFNSANAVNLGSNHTTISALTMSGGIDLNTNGFDLDVNGLVQLVDAGSNLFVGASTSLLSADSITINNGANVELNGGTIQINEEAGNGILDINTGGELVGHGTFSTTDAVAANTTLIVNDGAITARRDPAVILGPPQIGTLAINATDADARIDLDGAGELGAVIVSRNQTLDINIQLADIFNGAITMAQDSVLDMSNSWILGASATIDVDNGAIGGFPAVPAGVATIAGATFSQNSGTITVTDADGTLKIDAPFTMNGGSFVNNGLVVFNSSTTIAVAANFTMPTTSSSITVAENRTVNINANNFNMDGSNAATNVITVEQDGTLDIATTDYDPDSATNAFDGTINLNGGVIDVTTSDAEFVMDGVLNMHSTSFGLAGWLGEPLDIGNDVGSLDADVNVTGVSFADAQIGAQVDFNSDADVDIAAGGSLVFLTSSTVNFHTVNGGNNAQFTGAGTIVFNGAVNVVEAVTLNMVGGTVDFDGSDSVGETINVDAPLTISAATMSSFGRVNGVGTNLLDVNNSAGTGVLTVTLDNADHEWTLNGPGVMNLVNDNTDATLLAGSDVNLNGTVNVTGDVRITARVDIGGVVNIGTAAQPLRLAGGNNTDDPNTIAGGAISGAGLLGADDGKALHGFGTINTNIDFDGIAPIRATGGTLTINGAILDAGQVGTADSSGTLHVTNAWNNNVTTGVQVRGGTLSGGAITNDVVAGISGHGLVTARVINNSQLFASLGDTLIFKTAADDNDWDGTTNDGEIEAVSANIELRSSGPAFGFGGTVNATNTHTAFMNGFGLDFNPGSTLSLASGGKYHSTETTHIGGTVSVGAGGATIQVENNTFLEFETGSTTTLGSNLQLLNNNIIIEAGATFSGAGALVIPDGSHVVGENLANVGVLLDLQGAFRPGNSQGIGRINLFDFQEADTSELYIELIGTSLNAFDRLVASGDVIVDGFLSLDIDDIAPMVPFVPVLGNTFNIITGNSVTGQFDTVDVSGMPPGLAFAVNYLVNAVQLEVVNKPIFSADFDDDGDVDSTDLSIWANAYDLNQLGDADGDNDSDGADVLIWQRQFGSKPMSGSGASLARDGSVPEPSSLLLLLLAGLTSAQATARRR